MDERIRLGLDKGIEEFNEGAFFEAHDTLEDVWMDVRGESRLFFQGLIQLCIGYYHLTCENFTGAQHLFGRGVSKLKVYEPGHAGVDLASLLTEVRKTQEAVKLKLAGESYVPFWSLPKIKRSSV